MIYGDSSPPAWFPGQITKVTVPAITPPPSSSAKAQGQEPAASATTTATPAPAAVPNKPWKKTAAATAASGGSGGDKGKSGPAGSAVVPSEPLYDVLFEDGDTAENVSRLKIRKAGESPQHAQRSYDALSHTLFHSSVHQLTLTPSNTSPIRVPHVSSNIPSPTP